MTYYEILGIQIDASTEEINNAKNRLAKMYHPDVHADKGIDTTKRMQEILEAYAVLSNPQQRNNYDRTLKLQLNTLSGAERHFRDFNLSAHRSGAENETNESAEHPFVALWKQVTHLHELLEEVDKMDRRQCVKPGRLKQILICIFRFLHLRKYAAEREIRFKTIQDEVKTIWENLNENNISHVCRIPYAVNWVMIRWGTSRQQDYRVLLNKFEYSYLLHLNETERRKIIQQKKQMMRQVKHLLK